MVETSCYLFGRNNCTRKQHTNTLKAVVKVSINTELYSCQTTHLKPKNSYPVPILQKHQRLNWTADHVNATCGLNMKTRLRYGQTPSHLYYTAQPRGPCGCTAFILLFARFARSQQKEVDITRITLKAMLHCRTLTEKQIISMILYNIQNKSSSPFLSLEYFLSLSFFYILGIFQPHVLTNKTGSYKNKCVRTDIVVGVSVIVSNPLSGGLAHQASPEPRWQAGVSGLILTGLQGNCDGPGRIRPTILDPVWQSHTLLASHHPQRGRGIGLLESTSFCADCFLYSFSIELHILPAYVNSQQMPS